MMRIPHFQIYQMSFRECRALCEMLRSLSYTRIVSLQNFARPNFELVADILYWLAQKYDPQSDISDDINEEKDRVEFMRSIVNLFAVKARVKLNPKKLYQADADAVGEILKIATVLYKASISKATEQEEAAAFTLPAKVSNLKAHKQLSNQICDLGARLYDAIGREPDLRKVRLQAIQFLEGMQGVNEGNDQAFIESSIKTIMHQQEESTREMAKYVTNMEQEQRVLEEKLKKKTAQLERNEKRYRNLLSVKPAFMEEYQRLEEELAQLQQTYVNKYRNIDYLENQLEAYNKIEEEKLRKAKKELEKIRKKQQEDEIKAFKGQNQLDAPDEPEEERAFTRGQSRKAEKEQGTQGPTNAKKVHEEEDEDEGQEGEDNSDEEGSGEQIEDEDDDSDF